MDKVSQQRDSRIAFVTRNPTATAPQNRRFRRAGLHYDAQNRLRLVRNNGALVAEYYYDGKNRQIARSLNNVIRFSVWDGWDLIEEYSSVRSAAYLQGATGVIKSLMNNVYYYQDKLGSTTHIANASGTLLESFHYDLYGKPAETSAYGVVDLYAGERWVSELELYDLRNRFMSAELGRFLQADPIGFKGDGSNLYRYCHNDPVNRADPDGLVDTWTRQMLWQGALPWSVSEMMTIIDEQQKRQSASNNDAARDGRAVTSGEQKMARPYYGNSIDYRKVRVFDRSYFPGARTMSPNGRIYFAPKSGYYRADFSKIRTSDDRIAAGKFIHELEHVRQFQNGMSTGRLWFEHTFRGNYNYLPVREGKTFHQHGIEQRANIMEDYFQLNHGYGFEGQPSTEWYKQIIPSANE